ncbi:hypothetical protein [Streptomyces sp. NPDC008121]|uniref:hypothetical protein n=1 Tax=Streptomyces sp. NPDC008121 TaxID=3364809 RepID=UPI0036E3A28A
MKIRHAATTVTAAIAIGMVGVAATPALAQDSAPLKSADIQTAYNQKFTASAGDPSSALAKARQKMANSVENGLFRGCMEVDSTSKWIKVPNMPATGAATVYSYCW